MYMYMYVPEAYSGAPVHFQGSPKQGQCQVWAVLEIRARPPEDEPGTFERGLKCLGFEDILL